MVYNPSRGPPNPRSVALDSLDVTGGVVTRRILAYLLDIIFIALITTVLSGVALVLTIISFGLLHIVWFGLLHIVWAIIPFTAIIYATLTIGGAHAATWGMRLLNLHYRRMDGRRPQYLEGLVATVLFYVTFGVTSGFILLVPLFTNGHRTLHDILSGLVLVRSEAARRF